MLLHHPPVEYNKPGVGVVNELTDYHPESRPKRRRLEDAATPDGPDAGPSAARFRTIPSLASMHSDSTDSSETMGSLSVEAARIHLDSSSQEVGFGVSVRL